MPDTPLVSILMCAYNAGDYLSPALQSVLSQSWPNFEVVVIDDGSTDGSIGTAPELSDKRVRLVRQENTGRPIALNRGLALCRGELIAFQDADDLAEPTRIANQAAVMRDEPDLVAAFCGHYLLIGDRRVAPRYPAKDRVACATDIEAFHMPAHDPTGMWRKSLIAGETYDPDLRIAHAVDYITRLGERYPMRVVGEPLYGYRVHVSSLTQTDPKRRMHELDTIFRRACARRGVDPEALGGEARNVGKTGKRRNKDNNLAGHFIESVHEQRDRGLRGSAIWSALRCSLLAPVDAHYQKALAYALMPEFLRQRLRGRAARNSLVAH
ncbi:MAG: glycosyltransferase family A protein [Planctomycetota bacterium]